MNIWLFLREQWRLLSFFLLAVLLVLLVVVLDASNQHVHIRGNDVFYAGLLGFCMLIGYIVVEYIIRRPFYVELQSRLIGAGELAEASTFTQAATYEQQLFLELTHKYHNRYTEELLRFEEAYKFYELFVTRFAHQMKTPLTVIQLLEGELREQLQEQQERMGLGTEQEVRLKACQEILASMEEERNRLDHSMNMMLHTARLTSFEFDARMETVDCISLLREIVNEHKVQWIRLKLFPKIDTKQSEIRIQTDRKWFSFICDQIVRNALQYGHRFDPGRAARLDSGTTFTIGLERSDDQVIISFIDEGIGISERDQKHVFEPFFTGANGRTHSRATGMGLYLVKEVAGRLGIQVSIASQEGIGTTVTVQVPQAQFYSVAHSDVNVD